MAESCGIYGLPRKLINFLRQMEKYKESMKWNINEGPNKLSLTMTWSLNKDRLSFVDRMKRTLRLNSSWSEEGIDLPKRSGSFRKKVQGSPERRCPFCNKNLPPDKDLSKSSWNCSRNSSLNSSIRGSSFSPSRDTHFNRSLSFRESSLFSNRSSWSDPRSPPKTSTPKRDTNSLNRSEFGIPPDHSELSVSEQHSLSTSGSNKNIKLTYRTVEDIELSYEDLYQKAKEETNRQLDSIKKEWNRSIRKSTRKNYSSSSSTSSVDDIVNSHESPNNCVNDIIDQNGEACGIPSEPHIPAPPVREQGQALPQISLEGSSSFHSNILHNGLSMHQRTIIVKNKTLCAPKRLSYSTDIL